MSNSSPLNRSEDFRGIRHVGSVVTYEKADTWYPTWAKDNNLYTPYTDGEAGGIPVLSTWSPSIEKFCRNLGEGYPESPNNFDRLVETGNAVISGNDPKDLCIEVLPKFTQKSEQFHGSYPCGSLIHQGVWYYGQYYLHRWINHQDEKITYELGPFQGFRTSTDFGRTWAAFPRDDQKPLFGEIGRCGGGPPIRYGAPHFIDYGMEMEHSPDGYAYLCGHGSRDPDGIANWAAGDAIFLARFKPSLDTANKSEAYEFFAGLDESSAPKWVASVDETKPIMEWEGHCGIVNMTYFPAIRKYIALMCVAPTDGGAGDHDTWVTIADQPWGPWQHLEYLKAFGTQAYFACIPSKFISEDNLRFTMFWSANWYENSRSDPPGSSYALCVGEFELLR